MFDTLTRPEDVSTDRRTWECVRHAPHRCRPRLHRVAGPWARGDHGVRAGSRDALTERRGDRDRAGPAHRAPDPADPGRARLRALGGLALHPDASSPGARRGVRRVAGAVGGGPPTPAGAVNQDQRVLLDRAARRLRHRLRRPGAVPKIVGLSVQVGTRFPALQTSLGKVLLAELDLQRARPGAGGADPFGTHPSLEAHEEGARRRAAPGARARVGATTSSSPSASGRWPRRSATASG